MKRSPNRQSAKWTEAAQLATDEIHRNVKRLLDLHEQLHRHVEGTSRLRQIKTRWNIQLSREQDVRALIHAVSLLGRTVTGVFARRRSATTVNGLYSAPNRPLLKALRNRMRRLESLLTRKGRARKKSPQLKRR